MFQLSPGARMNDSVLPEVRSKIMQSVGQKNTKPELLLRKELFRRGFRYRLHHKKLPGKPDLTFTKWCAVVFVNGCFWHRHLNCRYSTTPKNNSEFWSKKFQENIERDARNLKELEALGWRVCTVWECQLKSDIEKTASDLAIWLTPSKKLY